MNIECSLLCLHISLDTSPRSCMRSTLSQRMAIRRSRLVEVYHHKVCPWRGYPSLLSGRQDAVEQNVRSGLRSG